VVVQGDHQLMVRVGEDAADTTVMRYVHHRVESEHFAVPPDARLEVGDGQGQVMESGLGDSGHGSPLRYVAPPLAN
jgi:hypothetical protein